MTDTIRMKDTFKSKAHNFIVDSYHGFMFSNIYTRLESFELGVAIIGRHFIMEIGVLDLVEEFKISKAGISCIINGYLEYICDIVVNEYYTHDELDFIYTLISTKCNSSRAVKQCLQIIALYKDKLHLKTYAFGKVTDYPILNIDDPIEKLCELTLISRRTINRLRVEVYNNHRSHELNDVITIKDIIYLPNMWLTRIANMSDKNIGEIISFMNNYPIQGRIIPTKEDVKRVFTNVFGKDIVNSNVTVNSILLMDMCKSAYKNEWDLLDLITLSDILDSPMAECLKDYRVDYHPYIDYIADRILTLLSNK